MIGLSYLLACNVKTWTDHLLAARPVQVETFLGLSYRLDSAIVKVTRDLEITLLHLLPFFEKLRGVLLSGIVVDHSS